MALQFTGQGTREGVLKKIAEFKVDETDAEKNPQIAFDKSQLDAFKALLTSEINALPTESNGVNVNAQATAHAGLRNFQVNIIPLKLHV